MGQAPYEAVVLGSLSFSQLLGALPEPVYRALSQGLPVYLFPEGLPESPKNRALAAAVSGKKRELRALGVRFLEGSKAWITASDARRIRDRGEAPGGNARLTPLAREILEGSD